MSTTAARLVALLVALAACKKSECEKLADLAESCLKMNMDDLEQRCMVDGPMRPLPACRGPKTCDELQACMDSWGCKLVLTGPDDKEPSLTCTITIGPLPDAHPPTAPAP
jgi:hypothetical protein